MKIVKKLTAGRYKIPVTLDYKDGRIFMGFGFSRPMIAEVKSMEGHKWHGFDEPNPRKIWSIKDSARNKFRLDFLAGENPYVNYDKPLIAVETERPLYEHQVDMLKHVLTRQYCIIAGEMGVGKTLVFIEALDHIEDIKDHEIWYVGPKSGVVAVGREVVKWRASYTPRMMTYQGLVKILRNWDPSERAPRFICFDESSKLKNPTSQRSQAAKHLAESVRAEWGDEGYVILMSGTPAPKAPTDWYHQCEITCPGFLKEGTLSKFKARMSIIEQRQSITGGVYPHLVSWLDDAKKCNKCGAYASAAQHRVELDYDHDFVASKNEVSHLNKRIADLVMIKLKKDCLDLPEKQYRIIKVRPTIEALRASRLIRKMNARAITVMTLLRELSDGFQYAEKVVGKSKCPQCHGTGSYKTQVPREEVDPLAPQDIRREDFEKATVDCDICDENNEIDQLAREAVEIGTPKDDALIELLDDHEDAGRFVIWGGFTATIERIIAICHKYGWATLRIDKKGYIAQDAHGEMLNKDDLLDAMDASSPRRQELYDLYPKVAVVGHPKAGGMALTFNLAPSALFYSNDFDGEARMQAEDRIHRMGMDMNRGATIIDLIHLPTDELVLNNLKKKKRLQSLTLGEIDDSFTSS